MVERWGPLSGGLGGCWGVWMVVVVDGEDLGWLLPLVVGW